MISDASLDSFVLKDFQLLPTVFFSQNALLCCNPNWDDITATSSVSCASYWVTEQKGLGGEGCSLRTGSRFGTRQLMAFVGGPFYFYPSSSALTSGPPPPAVSIRLPLDPVDLCSISQCSSWKQADPVSLSATFPSRYRTFPRTWLNCDQQSL